MKRQTQRNCTAFSRCTMTLLRRRGFWHVLHKSVTCLVRLTCTMCFRWMSAWLVQVSLSKPTCRDELARCACKCITCKSTKKNPKIRNIRGINIRKIKVHPQKWRKKGLQTDTSWPSWPSSSSSSSECGKSSGETKPVPVTHCHGNMFDPNSALLQYVSRFLLEHSWASSRKTNCTGPTAAKHIQKFPHWLHHSSPTKPSDPCLFAMLCGGFEKVKVPSHPANLNQSHLCQ